VQEVIRHARVSPTKKYGAGPRHWNTSASNSQSTAPRWDRRIFSGRGTAVTVTSSGHTHSPVERVRWSRGAGRRGLRRGSRPLLLAHQSVVLYCARSSRAAVDNLSGLETSQSSRWVSRSTARLGVVGAGVVMSYLPRQRVPSRVRVRQSRRVRTRWPLSSSFSGWCSRSRITP